MQGEAIWIVPQTLSVESPSGPLTALQLCLGGVPRGAVVLLWPERELAPHAPLAMNRFAEQGYESLAVGTGGTPENFDGATPPAVDVALARLQTRGWRQEQIGVVGYGEGAVVALAAALELELGAAVSVAPKWSGGDDPVLRYAVTSAHRFCAPWLGLVGGADYPSRELAALSDALIHRAPVFAQLCVYSGVGGPFYLDSAYPSIHAAAFDAWQRTVEWLNLRVVPRLTPLAEAWLRTGTALPG